MPIQTTTTTGYSVTEIQYGGGRRHHGPGNRGFYISPPADSPIRGTYEYPLNPNPHHDSNYADGNSHTQEDFYKTAGDAAVAAALAAVPPAWQLNIAFTWQGTPYTANGFPYRQS
jgi:hypothetical protein